MDPEPAPPEIRRSHGRQPKATAAANHQGGKAYGFGIDFLARTDRGDPDRLLPQDQRRSAGRPGRDHLRLSHRRERQLHHQRLQLQYFRHAAGRVLPVRGGHHQRLPGAPVQEVPAVVRRPRHRGPHSHLYHRLRHRRHRPGLRPRPGHRLRPLSAPGQVHWLRLRHAGGHR